MKKDLRILLIEDLPSDVELIKRELKKLGSPFELQVVEDEDGLKSSLEEFRPHIVLSDYILPRFSGLDALKIVQEFDPDLPFIIVTGSINELTAVECMKAGAWDYCIKENLSMLVPSIQSAFQKKRLIEENKQTSNALKESKEQFQSLIKYAPIGMVVVKDFRIQYINDYALRISGAKDKKEVLGRNLLEFVHPKFLEIVQKRLKCLVQGKSPGPMEQKFITIDGREREIEVNSVPIKFNGENAFLSIFRDITEEKELLKRYQELINHSNDAIFLENEGKFEFVNPKFIEMFGYDVSEITANGVDVLTIVASQSRNNVRSKMDLIKKGSDSQRGLCNFIGITKKGEKLYCEASLSILEYKGRKCILGIIRDRTEQHIAEDQIRKLSIAIEQSPLSVVITDRKGTIGYVNPAFTRITGYTPGEVIGKTPRILKSGRTPQETYRDLWATIKSKQVWTGQFINRRKDGTIFHEDVIISPILDADGNITHFLALKEDVTEKIELENRLRQAQKMEAIGTLAGGIAHDFNNILMPIIGYAELCECLIPDDSKLKAYIKEIQAASKRAKDLVQQILTFSRQSTKEHRPLNIVPVAKETLKLLRAAIPTSIEISQEIECQDATILADPVEIHQVLMNLCVNSQHAMPDGGVLTVRIKKVNFEEMNKETDPPLPAGTYVEILVKDTGIGIDKKNLTKIFEPYFTTKTHGRGTGLGLSVVHGIVTSSHGAIKVKSEVGKGTEFFLYFPYICVDHSETETLDPDRVLLTGKHERILFVDDDHTIVEFAKDLLSQLTYNVVGLTDPEKALNAFKEAPNEFDLVITDMTMPKMRGDKLAKAISEMNPNTPIIVCTGFSEYMDEQKAKELGIAKLLQKPFSPSSLAKAVRELLD